MPFSAAPVPTLLLLKYLTHTQLLYPRLKWPFGFCDAQRGRRQSIFLFTLYYWEDVVTALQLVAIPKFTTRCH